MLELYHGEPNGAFLKPLIALHEKAVPFTSRWFEADRLAQEEPGFPRSTEVQLQQERTGPVLVHAGAVLCGSFFILEYIAAALPGLPLHGSGAAERYRVQAWGQTLTAAAADVSLLGSWAHLAPALCTLDAAARTALQARIATLEPVERRRAWSALLNEPDAPTYAGGAPGAAVGTRALAAGSGYIVADIDAFAVSARLVASSSQPGAHAAADGFSDPHACATGGAGGAGREPHRPARGGLRAGTGALPLGGASWNSSPGVAGGAPGCKGQTRPHEGNRQRALQGWGPALDANFAGS